MTLDRSMATVVTLTDANFSSEVLEAQPYVLVEFWAEWCGPCRLMAPLLELVASQYVKKELKVGKVESDSNPVSRDHYQIQGLPALLLFHNGHEIARHEGAMAMAQLMAFLDRHLA